MSYKTNDKSFFDDVFEKPIEEGREELAKLEKKGSRKFLKLYDFGSSKLREEIKRKPAQYFFLFLTSFLGSVITSGVTLFMFSGNLVAQFVPKPVATVQGVQTASVARTIPIDKYDPLLLASKLKKKEGEFQIIDIRPMSEYLAGHITGSINVPVYGTSIVTKNGDLDAASLKEAFRTYLLSDKLLIIYAQNSYSTLPADIASLLSSTNKKVKALAVGWEEWYHLNSRK